MARKLLLIESGGKIKKLSQILGSDWTIKATMGHIRELASDGADSLGFDLRGNRVFCRFVSRSKKSGGIIKELKVAVSKYEQIYLATDPDREGETIAWHLAEVLNLKNPHRVVYSEITESAVKKALANPRSIDMNMVGSGLARACLDKLVGYKGSPLLWALNIGAKSMGRVQSAALHILCDREREIQIFKPTPYWSVFCDYLEGFRAFYLGSGETDTSKNAEEEVTDDALEPEDIKKPEGSRVQNQALAQRLVEIARSNPHRVVKVEGKTTYKKPPAPFITSTLQQASGSRLKFNPKKTMELAQSLYEKGLITYMRTDSVSLSPEFCASVRDWLQRKDPENLPDKVTAHRVSKNAQEAHEAIRPTDVNRSSTSLKQELTEDEFQLYLIIWLRAVASQCKSAFLRKSKIITQSELTYWQALGQVVEFSGYAKYWKDLGADTLLPSVKLGQTLTLEQALYEEKQTQPPPRYTEAKLVSAMEKKGIGRPSTYAPTVKILKERSYVELKKGKLHVTGLGLETDEFLGKVLPEILSADFTAAMEENLDAIAQGKKNWEGYLTSWNSSYFEGAIARAKQYLTQNGYSQKSTTKKDLERSDICCPKCNELTTKVPSKSKKLALPYFLKCSTCDVVMFYNEKKQTWELPFSKTSESVGTGVAKKKKAQKKTVSQKSDSRASNYACPVCGEFLTEKEYVKDGQTKKMLVCSNSKSGSDSLHKDVAFFQSRNTWWNPKLGELK
jgi:DNA topoisomerase I